MKIYCENFGNESPKRYYLFIIVHCVSSRSRKNSDYFTVFFDDDDMMTDINLFQN